MTATKGSRTPLRERNEPDHAEESGEEDDVEEEATSYVAGKNPFALLAVVA